ncbi:5-oxoprolinase subunit PxpA [Polaribacter sp.]|nr:5-oxoprolinase subunit PxpA [Polaribacter sp.]MDB4010911.1 5-oxoprolinase subunit PxpA [Polaribacter sp.]MDC1262103.1 5-oxoprolinase subunit PxpA [Polaribacter sp.]
MNTIAINCDVGEGVSNEHLLMPYISSCNIACGGHYGDVKTMDNTIAIAIENNVLIGAHPSFPDKENFGRKILKMTPEALQKSIESQLLLFKSRLDLVGAKMNHIKPHGALYNLITVDVATAKIFLKAIDKYAKSVFLYVPYNSVIARLAIEKNIRVVYEVFADRNYNSDLSLVSRNQENALITDAVAVFKHVVHMYQHQEVIAISGEKKPIIADTFCVHGDQEKALSILIYLSEHLKKQGIAIE